MASAVGFIFIIRCSFKYIILNKLYKHECNHGYSEQLSSPTLSLLSVFERNLLCQCFITSFPMRHKKAILFLINFEREMRLIAPIMHAVSCFARVGHH